MKNNPFLQLSSILALINLVVVILILLIQGKLPPSIPLFYGQASGNDQLVTKLYLTIPSLGAICTIIIGNLLKKSTKDIFLHQILLGTMVTTTILSLYTTLKIILLVSAL
ncbi:hypothetical protein A2382_04785 [Candidatus Woesebacteria bacterium RIFOXYB1_FULL_38_16]|uniref:DUF1648 domain-containing protein n=1 Tax=Candidatus Woesebacteria bacterium RIFOXYB1_FULL_38_16 TaxID=1802538 RepID=A0A1F8CUH6_9BACT|nr:MAG: hypothetical protein A2191_00380 [Candidatus Woesebacteria bacterium RIFOXYA1_FULL_38_9]OGM79974.1 MAG: hypothetical protein A2382_04785 [Candidatus Woesebacteria bacterium RIFOXYB1_FULL_38_16]